MFRVGKTTKRFAVAAILVVAAAATLLVSGAITGSSSSSTTAGAWRLLPDAPFAVAAGRTSVWTGTEMIVSGSTAPDGNSLKSVDVAAAYNPATNTWRRLPAPPRTDNYCRRSAVWTGKELLIWGCGQVAFNPSTNNWRRLPSAPTHQGIVVWTGHELIGWGGGCCGDVSEDGSAYNPGTNSWRKLAPAPVAGQQSPTGTWTGRELVIFNGLDPDGKAVGGAAYNPKTDTWRRIAHVPGRIGGEAIWDGREILVVARGAQAAAGFAYNPTTNHWRPIAPMKSARTQALAVWTGRQLIIWGGETGESGSMPANGLVYDPQADRWSPLTKSPLLGRFDPTGVWTGSELIVWGGVIGTPVGTAVSPKYPTVGAAFTPSSVEESGRRTTAHALPPLPACC